MRSRSTRRQVPSRTDESCNRAGRRGRPGRMTVDAAGDLWVAIPTAAARSAGTPWMATSAGVLTSRLAKARAAPSAAPVSTGAYVTTATENWTAEQRSSRAGSRLGLRLDTDATGRPARRPPRSRVVVRVQSLNQVPPWQHPIVPNSIEGIAGLGFRDDRFLDRQPGSRGQVTFFIGGDRCDAHGRWICVTPDRSRSAVCWSWQRRNRSPKRGAVVSTVPDTTRGSLIGGIAEFASRYRLNSRRSIGGRVRVNAPADHIGRGSPSQPELLPADVVARHPVVASFASKARIIADGLHI